MEINEVISKKIEEQRQRLEEEFKTQIHYAQQRAFTELEQIGESIKNEVQMVTDEKSPLSLEEFYLKGGPIWASKRVWVPGGEHCSIPIFDSRYTYNTGFTLSQGTYRFIVLAIPEEKQLKHGDRDDYNNQVYQDC